jgi:hypothetical protein
MKGRRGEKKSGRNGDPAPILPITLSPLLLRGQSGIVLANVHLIFLVKFFISEGTFLNLT